MVTCMEQREGFCSYIKRAENGALIRAEASLGESAGVDLSFDKSLQEEGGIPVPKELLSCLLTAIVTESKKTPIRICLSAEGTPGFSDFDLPCCASPKKTVAVLLGEVDGKTADIIKTKYGEENVKTAKNGLIPVAELIRSAAVNVLFSGPLREVATFLGIPIRETSHLLGLFPNGTDGFILASSPDLLDAVRNRETLLALQQLSQQEIKAGILITQQ